jgi:hypothetical protein
MPESHISFDEYISKAHASGDKLSNLVLDMLRLVKLDPTKDQLGLMIASFGYKQLEHFKSIRLLVDAGQHRDAVVISRVMMEGFIVLNWASLGPERPIN